MCGGLVLVLALALALVFGGVMELGFGRGFWEERGFFCGFLFYLVRAICMMVVVHEWGPCSQGFGMLVCFYVGSKRGRSWECLVDRIR